MRRAALPPILLLVAAALSGCIQGDTPPGGLGAARASDVGSPARVVVAYIDTGTNFFHEEFEHETAPPDFVQAVPFAIAREGSYADRLRSTLFDTVKTGELYWIEGTRVLAITFGQYHNPAVELIRGPIADTPLLDDYGHGTGVGGEIAEADPEAWLVSVEVSEETFYEALEWTANQPWIDVVSVSWGSPANVDLPIDPSGADTTRRMASDGKIVVYGSGNEPSFTLFDDSDGPPWVIGVSAARSNTHGWAVMGSRPSDVIADYVVRGPRFDDVEGDESNSGTSFSCPVVAGTLARAVREVRTAAGYSGGIEAGALIPPLGLEARHVRDALNATALYWGPGDFDATRVPEGHPVATVAWASAPVPPAVGSAGPWLVMGWGYVNATLAPAMVDLLLGKTAPPPKPGEASEFMERWQKMRSDRWDGA